MLESLGVIPSQDLPLLEARSVGEAAEKAVTSLALPRDRAFNALYNYLAVDEPAVHLMPLHFLPHPYQSSVEPGSLHPLGVAAKLEYARSRWIDEIVDLEGRVFPSAVHRLHDELVRIIVASYSEVLYGRRASTFFQTLSKLYASHTTSVAVDASWARSETEHLSRSEYSAQVDARNGSFRASVDAVLLLAEAPAELLHQARKSWHLWVLGAQLYDDALDVEEDFESQHPTWTVARTLTGFREDEAHRPDRDRFYEAALANGALTETLTWAESCFESAARLAEIEFPSWAALQRACITQTSRLRQDLEKLTTEATRRTE